MILFNSIINKYWIFLISLYFIDVIFSVWLLDKDEYVFGEYFRLIWIGSGQSKVYSQSYKSLIAPEKVPIFEQKVNSAGWSLTIRPLLEKSELSLITWINFSPLLLLIKSLFDLSMIFLFLP